ncbi:YdgA family protein [Tamlana haliotis]|uniref:YdgA family protein n=1 Tax=Pseudotamlana haliotis TaxID=2614804 RepID=A0A6N6MM77_9FLAO|nr:YdgA family protein [Tamlana haliotis]KAB1071879.1 YdgA family protein [Tamlana haliotis]
MKLKYVALIVFVVILAVIAVPVSNYFLKGKIEKALANLPKHVSVETKNIEVDITSGTMAFEGIDVIIHDTISNETDLKLKLNAILVRDVDYMDFIFSNILNIKEVDLDAPKMVYYKQGKKKKPSGPYNASQSPEININRVNIEDGNAQVLDQQTDSLLFEVKHFKIKLQDVSHTPDVSHRIPVTFHDFNITADGVRLNVGNFDRLFIDNVHIEDQVVVINKLHLKTMYSKKELSKHIKTERDHLDLKLDSLTLDNIDFGYKNDTIFYFSTQKSKLHHLDLEVYRDKLVADDHSIKLLYSQMLRDLKFDLDVAELEVVDSRISYKERVNHRIVPGEIFFTEFNATMKNISNTYPEGGKTEIKTTSKFMDEALLKTDCEFDVNNVYDRFLFKGNLGKFHAVNMNQFLVPNLNVKFKGILYHTYFTIDGTANHSSIHLKTKFDGLHVSILRNHKHHHKKNRVLSAIANIFVSKTSKKGDSPFAEAVRHNVKRDKTKSVFNFLWLNVKDGLIHAKN